MSSPEREIVGWLQLGGSLWSAAQLAEVALVQAEEWVEHGRRYPNGIHSAFAREVGTAYSANGHRIGKFGRNGSEPNWYD